MPRLPALLSTAAFTVWPRRRAPAVRRKTSPTNPGFETGDLTGWTVVEGDAFSDASVTDQITYSKGPFHHHGRYHLFSGAEDDHKVGILESDVFTLDTDVISFLISGGNDPELLRVDLVRAADEVVLRRQTGPGDEAYVRITWSVEPWRGKRVFFRLVDASRFGHINVDDIRTVEASRGDNGLTFARLGQDNQPAAVGAITAWHYGADPLRPQYHYTPYQGRIGDPTGLIEWCGRYHSFARYDPGYWAGQAYWTHADGPDPVRFRLLRPALPPPPAVAPGDNSGVRGGSAVDDDGVLTLVYTLHSDRRVRSGAVAETVGIATSTDGVRFVPYEGNPVIRRPPHDSIGGFRDPKVFRDPDDGSWKMVVGSGDGARGEVHLYTSGDLRQWQYEGLLFAGDNGRMWGSPSLFPLDGQWVLIYSAVDSGETSYVIGAFDGRRFTARHAGTLDHGPDFFAAQHFADASGRDIVVGWMGAQGDRQPCRVNGHAGAFSIPREVFIRSDGGLGSRPLSDVDTLHTGDVLEGPASGPIGPVPRRIAFGDALDIGMVVNVAESTPTWTLTLHRSAAERTELRYDATERTCTLDTTRAGYGTPHLRDVGVTPDAAGRIRLRLLLDRSSIEVFTGDGTALSARVFPRYVESREVRVEPHGGPLWVEHMWACGMGSCWM